MVALTLWTEKEDNVLRSMWDDKNVTTRQIANEIGRNKNSVIGRARRIGLPKKATTRRPRIKKQVRIEGLPPVSMQQVSKEHKQPKERQVIEIPPILQGMEVSILDVSGCRAIIAPHAAPHGLALCCNQPIKEGNRFAFCEHHHAIYTNTPRQWSR